MSHSRFVHERFRRRARRRKAVAVVYVAAMLAYLGWRTTIVNGDALGLSLVYLTAEVLGFVLGLTMIFTSWDYRHREPPPAPEGLAVDVFVTTYVEPVELVRWTLVAAKEITYPHRTFVLDDGNRPELKTLADELGVRYLARGQNVHAKAGNLNHALRHSTADFVMVLDADHIALPHALDVMLGFFRDGRVAMVQTPQDFYNIDAFQYFNARRGGLWHDQLFFYSIAEPCRDAFNGASCSGTGVVYRRAALDAIGGIPVDTVTEDMHTSLKLHKAGWQVVYLNEPVAYGVAAADIREYYRTRHRWAHGNLRALRIENVLFCRGLTLGQRLSYLTLGSIYLEGWQQLLLFAVPVVSLLSGWPPFEITVFNVLVVLVFPLLTVALLQELGCGLARAWVNEVFGVARFPLHVLAWAALLGRRMPFRTSSKTLRGRIDWTLLAPQLTVLALSLGAFVAGVVRLALDFKVGPLAHAVVAFASGAVARVEWNTRLDQGYTVELVVVSGFWALFNATKVVCLVRKAVADARASTDDYRFDARLPLEIDAPTRPVLGRVDRISLSWLSAAVFDPEAPAVGARLAARLYLPAAPLAVECVVVTRHPLAGGARIDCKLAWRDPAARERLARSLLSVDWHREFMHRHTFFTTPIEALGRLLSLRWPFPPSERTWSPALVGAPDGGRAFGVFGLHGDGRSGTLLAFRRLDPNAVVEVDVLTPAGVDRRQLRLIGREPLGSLSRRGLDGAEVQRYRASIEGMTTAEAGERAATSGGGRRPSAAGASTARAPGAA